MGGGAETFADYSQWEQWQGSEVRGGDGSGCDGKPAASVSAAAPAESRGEEEAFVSGGAGVCGDRGAVEAAEERLKAAREMIEDPSVAIDARGLTAALPRWSRRRRRRMGSMRGGRS